MTDEKGIEQYWRSARVSSPPIKVAGSIIHCSAYTPEYYDILDIRENYTGVVLYVDPEKFKEHRRLVKAYHAADFDLSKFKEYEAWLEMQKYINRQWSCTADVVR